MREHQGKILSSGNVRERHIIRKQRGKLLSEAIRDKKNIAGCRIFAC